LVSRSVELQFLRKHLNGKLLQNQSWLVSGKLMAAQDLPSIAGRGWQEWPDPDPQPTKLNDSKRSIESSVTLLARTKPR